MIHAYDVKLIISGNTLELYEYERPVFKNLQSAPSGRRKGYSDSVKDRSLEYQIQSTRKTNHMIKRLCLNNLRMGFDELKSLSYNALY